MKRGYLPQERHPASQSQRQKLQLGFLIGSGDQMSRVSLFIETVARANLKIDELVHLIVR